MLSKPSEPKTAQNGKHPTHTELVPSSIFILFSNMRKCVCKFFARLAEEKYALFRLQVFFYSAGICSHRVWNAMVVTESRFSGEVPSFLVYFQEAEKSFWIHLSGTELAGCASRPVKMIKL